MSVVVSADGVTREAPGMYAAVEGVVRAIAEPAPELADLTADATATAANIEAGYTAYVNGVKVAGELEVSNVEYEVIEITKSATVTFSLPRVTKISGTFKIGLKAGIFPGPLAIMTDTTIHSYLGSEEDSATIAVSGNTITIPSLQGGANNPYALYTGTVVLINDPNATALF
ncbi:MAG: hypothetical protein IJ042_01925 [Butyricicoccus sp.]|nr:hypothetical protein [Butyricicoccus sp.]